MCHIGASLGYIFHEPHTPFGHEHRVDPLLYRLTPFPQGCIERGQCLCSVLVQNVQGPLLELT